MGFEFDESEMYPCDICGEFWPMGEMHELEDERIVYRNGKKVLILAGKAAPKVLIEDRLATLIGSHNSQQGSHRYEKSDIDTVEDKNTN